jgi:hypothetical protein
LRDDFAFRNRFERHVYPNAEDDPGATSYEDDLRVRV